MRYRLDDLGWQQFQNLCQALLKLELGGFVEAWGTGHDLGRDAYLRVDDVKGIAVPAVFQVKFVDGAGAAGARPGPRLRSALAADLSKLSQRLLETGDHVATYFLITNAELSGEMRGLLERDIGAVGETIRAMIWDGKDICSMLDSKPLLRRAYPELLSLTDVLIELAADGSVERRRREGLEADTCFAEGSAAYKKGHVDQALAHWKKVAIHRPDDHLLHNWIGLAHKSKGELLDAARSFEQATALDATDPVPFYNWANCLTMLERCREAVVLYDRAIALKPDYADAYGNKAVALAQDGDLAGAFQTVTLALDIAPESAHLHHNRASYYMDMGEADEAAREYKKAVELNQSEPMYQYDLGVAYIELDEYQAARPCFEKAVSRKPSWAEAHCNLGLTLFEIGLMKSAEKELHEALKLKPTLFQAHAGLGNVSAAQQHYTAAIDHYRRAVRHGDDSSRVHLRLAAVLGASGDYHAASAEATLVVQSAPTEAIGFRYLGLALKSMGDDEGAIQALLRAAELGSEDPLVFALMGIHHLGQDAYENALLAFQKELELSGNNISSDTYYGLAIACMGCGKYKEAREHCESLVRIGEAARGHCIRGQVEKASGDLAASREQFREASRIHPKCSEVHAHLSDTLLQAGDLPNAVREAETGLELDDHSAECWYALSKCRRAQRQDREARAAELRALRIDPKVDLRPHMSFGPNNKKR